MTTAEESFDPTYMPAARFIFGHIAAKGESKIEFLGPC